MHSCYSPHLVPFGCQRSAEGHINMQGKQTSLERWEGQRGSGYSVGSFPRAQMVSKARWRAGLLWSKGEDSVSKHTRLSGPATVPRAKSAHKACCHGRRQEKRRTTRRQVRCLPKAGQFRTKLNVTPNDLNRGSLHTGGSRADLGLQKSFISSTLGPV